MQVKNSSQAKEVIDRLLREANLTAYSRVLPGEKPEKQIILVPRSDVRGSAR